MSTKIELFRFNEHEFTAALEGAPARASIALAVRAAERVWPILDLDERTPRASCSVLRRQLDACAVAAHCCGEIAFRRGFSSSVEASAAAIDRRFDRDAPQAEVARLVASLGTLTEAVTGACSHNRPLVRFQKTRIAALVFRAATDAPRAARPMGFDEHVDLEIRRDLSALQRMKNEELPLDLLVDPSDHGPFGRLWLGAPPRWTRD